MKEARIIAFIGIYGSLIMANTTKGEIAPWFWMGCAIIYTLRYTYLMLIK